MRALERAYLRVLLDPTFAARLRDEGGAQAEGLAPDEAALLAELPAEALSVERSGRRRHLWLRARGELPRTLARAEARLDPRTLQALRDRVFSVHLWHPERTLPLPLVGRGYELASHVRDALEALAAGAGDPELELLADLARLERARLAARLRPTEGEIVARVRSRHDLARAVAELERPAAALRLAGTVEHRMLRDGSIRAAGAEGPAALVPGERAMKRPTALVLAPRAKVELHSYRIDNYIKASLHYLSMGRAATDVGKVYAAMSKASRSGAADWFEASEADRYFRREGHELYLRDELYFGCTPTLFDPDLRLAFLRDHGAASLHVPLGAELLEMFSRILPRLRPTVPRASLEAVLAEEERDFVEQLREAGFLEEVPLQPVPARTGHGLRLIGHAALALETPAVRVLFDPLFAVRDRDDVDVLHELDHGVDAVVLSHPHWDHFNIDTLLQIPRDTTMIVPALTRPPSLENVDMGALLRELGFTRIVALRPWTSVDVADVRVTAIPFHGEQSGPHTPQDWMTYHATTGGRSLLGVVDACHDSHCSMDQVMREVHARLGPVDVLLAPYSGFHYPIAMFTRRPFYMGPGMEQYSGGPDDAVRWCTMLGARLLVPYAGFVWRSGDYLRPEDQTHRGSLRRLRSLVRSHPRGPLLVLEPGGPGLCWAGADAPLEVPESLEEAGVA